VRRLVAVDHDVSVVDDEHAGLTPRLLQPLGVEPVVRGAIERAARQRRNPSRLTHQSLLVAMHRALIHVFRGGRASAASGRNRGSQDTA
jgi:hypothetical protein